MPNGTSAPKRRRNALGVKRLRKLLSCLASPIYRKALLKHGVAAAVEHHSVLKWAYCKTIVDIGANRGQFALAARACCEGARIISFEPLAGPSQVFREIFAKDAKTSLHQLAIGPVARDAVMHVSSADDSSSLLPIGELQVELFPGTEEVRTTDVRVATLQDFVKAADLIQPSLLKIDVQGYELAVLEGCGPLLEEFSFVYVECSFVELYSGQAVANEIVDWLHLRGFSLTSVHNISYGPVGMAIQADFLFRRAE